MFWIRKKNLQLFIHDLLVFVRYFVGVFAYRKTDEGIWPHGICFWVIVEWKTCVLKQIAKK